jgi:GT2 family glycosyltransferase
MEEVAQPLEQPQGPSVSVLVLSFNRDAHLRGCLEALERSVDRQRLQIIVLDPGSRRSASLLQPDFPEVTILRMPRNFGATKALNIGLRTAKADLVFFLDPAVEVQPDTISKLAAALEESRDAAAVCPLLVDTKGQPVPQVRPLPDRETLVRIWRTGEGIPTAVPSGERTVVGYPGRKALLIRLNFLRGMNFFDEHYGEWGADLELAFQIQHAAKKTYILGDIAVVDRSAGEPGESLSASDRALLAADRANGVARFLERRTGLVGGLLFRAGAILGTLFSALTFQEPGFSWSLFMNLLGGTKIDGSQ